MATQYGEPVPSEPSGNILYSNENEELNLPDPDLDLDPYLEQ